MWKLIKEWIPALRSRKTRVALVTFIVALGGKFGLDLEPELIYSIVALGVAIIGGIAIEDHGQKSAASFKMDVGTLNGQPTAKMSKTGSNGRSTG